MEAALAQSCTLKGQEEVSASCNKLTSSSRKEGIFTKRMVKLWKILPKAVETLSSDMSREST